MLFLQVGLCFLSVLACEDATEEHLREVARRVPAWVRVHDGPKDCTLTVVSSCLDATTGTKWRAIAETWARAQQTLQEHGSKTPGVWRALYQLGRPLDTNAFLFETFDSDHEDFFCLMPAKIPRGLWNHASWIVHTIQVLAMYWHVLKGGTPLHAAGVARHDRGYLFLGPSGAGKSTVAVLSGRVQGATVHDDWLLVGRRSGNYFLAHPDSHIAPALRAILLLRKGDTDRLAALSPQATCAHLARSILDYMTGQDLSVPWIRQAFHNAAAIARSIPGYELCFRKSPDFWQVIDVELGP